MGSYRRVDLEYSQCVSDLSRLAPAPAATCEVSSEDETRESRLASRKTRGKRVLATAGIPGFSNGTVPVILL